MLRVSSRASGCLIHLPFAILLTIPLASSLKQLSICSYTLSTGEPIRSSYAVDIR